MTRHFANLPESTTVGERDGICSALFKGRDTPRYDRVFHESGPVAFYERDGLRAAPLCCIHCGRTFEGEPFETQRSG